MIKLSKNFSRDEFACKCGCGFDEVDPDLVRALQSLRDWWRRPVQIESGCRCERHNRLEGGAKNSQHLLGKAADIVVKGVRPSEVYRFLCLVYPHSHGIGSYESFTHLDVREERARW